MVRWKLEYFSLFIMSVIQLCKSQCPTDVQGATEKCLSAYLQSKKILEDSEVKLYMGTDVETIRSICSFLNSAVQCVKELKSKCPDTEHPLIEAQLYNEMSMAQLCYYPSIYERYAQYRSCFRKVRVESEKCLQSYRTMSEPVMIKQLQHNDKNAQKELCTQYDTFLTCLKTRVRVQCGHEAASLVEVLARPEVKASDHCRNDTQSTTTKKPTGKPARHNAVTAGKGRMITSSSLLYLTLTYLSTLYIFWRIH